MTVNATWGKPPLEALTITGEDAEHLVEICEMARRFCDQHRETREGVRYVREFCGRQLAQMEDLMQRIFEATECV